MGFQVGYREMGVYQGSCLGMHDLIENNAICATQRKIRGALGLE